MAWISYRLHRVGIAGCNLIVEVLVETLRDVKDRGTGWSRHLHLHPSQAWVLDCSYSSRRGSVHPDKLLQLWGGSHPASWLLLLLLNNLQLLLLLLLLSLLTMLLLLLLHLHLLL